MGTDYQELSILKKTHNHDENLPLQPFLVEGRCGYPPQMHLLWLLFLRGSTPFCHWKGRSGLSRQPGQHG